MTKASNSTAIDPVIARLIRLIESPPYVALNPNHPLAGAPIPTHWPTLQISNAVLIAAFRAELRGPRYSSPQFGQSCEIDKAENLGSKLLWDGTFTQLTQPFQRARSQFLKCQGQFVRLPPKTPGHVA
jgi:hypothetical protein